MKDTLVGQRLLDAEGDAAPHAFGDMVPGDYRWFPKLQRWVFCAPNGAMGMISADRHTITEHPVDHAITVAEILFAYDKTQDPVIWRGTLIAGTFARVGP